VSPCCPCNTQVPSEKVALAQKMMITKSNIAGTFVVSVAVQYAAWCTADPGAAQFEWSLCGWCAVTHHCGASTNTAPPTCPGAHVCSVSSGVVLCWIWQVEMQLSCLAVTVQNVLTSHLIG
jgi:hypothetical protein